MIGADIANGIWRHGRAAIGRIIVCAAKTLKGQRGSGRCGSDVSLVSQKRIYEQTIACSRTEAGYDLLDPFDVFPIEFSVDGRSGAPIDYRPGNIPHRSGNTKSYRFANDWRARALFLSVGSRFGGRCITEQTQHYQTYDRDDQQQENETPFHGILLFVSYSRVMFSRPGAEW
jgi:hypothetical protein